MHAHTARFGVTVSGARNQAPHGPKAQDQHVIGYLNGQPVFEIAGGAPTQLERLKESRAEKFKRVDELAGVSDRDLTDEESAEITTLRAEVDAIDTRIDDFEEFDKRRANAAAADQSETRNEVRPAVTVTNEERTYRKRGQHSFFADAFRSQFRNDRAATERLDRHMQEVNANGELEQRDVTTGEFGGLIVPQHLVEEFAAVLRNGRAIANAVRGLPLPDEGMVFKVPRGQTGSTVAAQATQNTAVSETNVDFDDDITIDVRTFAGQQDVSRQSLERGTPGLDELVYADLIAAYAAAQDTSLIKDDGTSGTHKGLLAAVGISTVTYTDATPTVPEFWLKLADAVQKTATNRKLSATLIGMHPRRWGWIIGSTDTQNRPLVVHGNQSDAVNAMGAAAADFGEGQLVGTLQGLPVLVDANIPVNLGAGTDEDRVIVLRRSDPILWEEGAGIPRRLRFEDVGSASLTIKLLVYGYSAFTAERFPKGVTVISGTGLVTPTF